MSTCEKDFTKLSINIEGIYPGKMYDDIVNSWVDYYHPTGLKEGEEPNSMVQIKLAESLNMINSLTRNKPEEDFKLDMCVANKCINKTPPMVMIDTSKKYKIHDILPRIDNNTIVSCYNNVSSDIGPDNNSVIHKCSIGVYDKTIGKCIYTPDFYFPQSKSK